MAKTFARLTEVSEALKLKESLATSLAWHCASPVNPFAFLKSLCKALHNCYRDAKQFTGLSHCQARDIRRMDFAFNTSFAAVNAAKVMMKENNIPFSMNALKSLMYNSYILKRFFELSGFKPNRNINAKIVKELIDIATYQAA